MANDDENAKDPPFHFEIWRGPRAEFSDEPKAIYYVENHNTPCSYNELANEFSSATRLMISVYREGEFGNWVAPLAHLARQTLELALKSLLVTIRERDNKVPEGLLGRHDLQALWALGTGWLDEKGFDARRDARRADGEHLIRAYSSIDPSGDLFRFGVSRKTAFGKQKSYDRVGIILDQFEREFDAAIGFLKHWDAVVLRKTIAELEGWENDPYFNADDFPRID